MQWTMNDVRPWRRHYSILSHGIMNMESIFANAHTIRLSLWAHSNDCDAMSFSIHCEFVCLHFGLLISLVVSKRLFTSIQAIFATHFGIGLVCCYCAAWMHSLFHWFGACSVFTHTREPRISNEKCTNFNESFMNISRCTFFRIFHQCQIARIDNVSA